MNIPKKKKGKRAKWLSAEALQIAEKRQEVKSKGEKERYTQLNADSKEQQGEIRKPSSVINAKKQRHNRTGNMRDLFKIIRDTKGIFHAKMGTIKDRNGMDLTEAEDIKKRWQEYTELYKRDLHDPNNHGGMITHLEPESWNLKSSGPQEASL